MPQMTLLKQPEFKEPESLTPDSMHVLVDMRDYMLKMIPGRSDHDKVRGMAKGSKRFLYHRK